MDGLLEVLPWVEDSESEARCPLAEALSSSDRRIGPGAICVTWGDVGKDRSPADIGWDTEDVVLMAVDTEDRLVADMDAFSGLAARTLMTEVWIEASCSLVWNVSTLRTTLGWLGGPRGEIAKIM